MIKNLYSYSYPPDSKVDSKDVNQLKLSILPGKQQCCGS